MITAKGMNDLLLKYANSKEGKKKIGDAIGVDLSGTDITIGKHNTSGKKGKIKGDLNKSVLDQAQQYGEEMKQILMKYMPVTNYHQFPIVPENMVVVGEPHKDETEENIVLTLSFEDYPDSLERDSFIQNQTGKPLHNIVLLYEYGYDYELLHPLWGMWQPDPNNAPIRVPARTHLESNFFVQKAVDEFNAAHGDKDGIYARGIGAYVQ